MCAILFSQLMGATKTGLSSLLARHRANHHGPYSLAAFPRLVYFTKVSTCWYLLHSGNPAHVGHLSVTHRRMVHVISPPTCNCRSLLRSQEPFKRLDFWLRQAFFEKRQVTGVWT